MLVALLLIAVPAAASHATRVVRADLPAGANWVFAELEVRPSDIANQAVGFSIDSHVAADKLAFHCFVDILDDHVSFSRFACSSVWPGGTSSGRVTGGGSPEGPIGRYGILFATTDPHGFLTVAIQPGNSADSDWESAPIETATLVASGADARLDLVHPDDVILRAGDVVVADQVNEFEQGAAHFHHPVALRALQHLSLDMPNPAVGEYEVTILRDGTTTHSTRPTSIDVTGLTEGPFQLDVTADQVIALSAPVRAAAATIPFDPEAFGYKTE